MSRVKLSMFPPLERFAGTPSDNKPLGSCSLTIFPREEVHNKLLPKRTVSTVRRREFDKIKAKIEKQARERGHTKWMTLADIHGS